MPVGNELENLCHFCCILSRSRASQVALVVRNRLTNAGDVRRCGFDPGVGRIPWRTAGQPTPAFLPGESHGQRSLAGCSPWGRTRLNCLNTSRKDIEDKQKTGSLFKAWPFWGLGSPAVYWSPSSFSSLRCTWW